MQSFLVFCSLVLLLSCSSSGKKDPDKKMDDTARADNPLPPVSGIEPVKVPVADIPATLKLIGTAQEAWKWQDNLGDNLLILSVDAPYRDKTKNEYGEEGQTAGLHAVQYAKKEGAYRQVWILSDTERACPFDITCAFIQGAVTITDLDADGLAEAKVQYRMACRSDVSPATMKLVMHEGETKYSLRGLTWYGMGEAPFDVTESNANLEKLPGYRGKEDEFVKTFGRYESEKDFAGAPAGFLSYARSQWIKFVKESTE